MKIRTLLTQFVLLMLCWQSQFAVAAATSIADQPLFATNNVPPNMMLALSVEWPTGTVAAYGDLANTSTGWACNGRATINSNSTGYCYYDARRYLGYFDPESCYKYYYGKGATLYNTPDQPSTSSSGTRSATRAATEYFVRTGAGSGTNSHICSGAFSGNFMNWASMHAADAFRFAMTGGDRVIDTSSLTVLEKGRNTAVGGFSQFPVKLITATSSSTNSSKTNVAPSTISPYSWTNLYARVTNGTTELDPFSDTATRGRVIQISNNSSFTHDGTNNLMYTFMVRNKVCDTSFQEYGSSGDYGLCQQYTSGNYKPVGIIQKNASKMRFGVTSYLLIDSSASDTVANARAGGVVRARMKSVGPTYAVTSGTGAANPYAEWSESTGVLVTHPDSAMLSSAETNGGAVTQSGVINYINKFGKANGYKRRDTFAELYYAALRSLRNMNPVSSYVANLTSSMYDGFPIITSTASESDVNARPIQYWCQQSNILAIADSNCHTDVDVPGNTLAGYSGHPTNDITDDSTINVKTLEGTLNTYEGISTLTGYLSSSRTSTYHVSALAYWANTTDILTDNSSKAWTAGAQKVKSYFVDVQENGSDGNTSFDSNGVPTTKNQLFYAAKYGGFDDYNSDGKPANTSTWGNSYGFPNNLFYGSRPDLMIDSLNTVVNSALSRSLSGAGATISTVNYSSSDSTSSGAYIVSYNSKYWTGDIKGYLMTVDSSGTPTLSYKWSAKSLLDTLVASSGWSSSRKVITYNGSAGVPFLKANLTSTQQTALTPTTSGATLQYVINYLRGDTSYDGTYFRKRNNVLGDIVDSEATVVSTPSATYSADIGYSTFKTTYAARSKVIYAGANDGMLHAFNGDVGSTTTDPASAAGKELWAYIPNMVFAGPSGTATTDGLIVRTSISDFTHKYYVNSTPISRDVDFYNVKGVTRPSSSSSDWHTLLVGGMGKGGKGYYCIDITDPTSWTSESAVAGKVLWEFTDTDMGYSFGSPIIAKTARDGWVVILSSGYNNTTGSNPGKGYLYIVNAKTGALIQKIATGVGSSSTPSGFAHPEVFLPSTASYTVDYVYGGDLLGNLWRFDLRSSTATSYDSPKLIATLKDASGNVQPVTTAPKIEIGSNGVRRWVFVGTGKLLGTSDLTDTQQQTFYAIRDGSKTSVYRNETDTDTTQTALPSAVDGFPVSRSNMVAVTDLTKGYTADSSKPMGWYYDMGVATATSEKVSTALTANEGLISWTGYIPATDDPCSPGASSRVYVVDYDNATSRITDSEGNTINYYASSDTLVKVQFIKSSTGKIRAVYTSGDATLGTSQIQKLTGNFGRTSGQAIRLSWREIMN